MPDLNQMLIFVRVVEAGSFSAAAQALGMAKPTVSQHVTQLEERLGIRLLQRTPRLLHLTDPGAEYFRRAQELIRAAGAAEAAVTAFHEMPRGTLRVTAPRDLAPGWSQVAEQVRAGALAIVLPDWPLVRVPLRLVYSQPASARPQGADVAVEHGASVDYAVQYVLAQLARASASRVNGRGARAAIPDRRFERAGRFPEKPRFATRLSWCARAGLPALARAGPDAPGFRGLPGPTRPGHAGWRGRCIVPPA